MKWSYGSLQQIHVQLSNVHLVFFFHQNIFGMQFGQTITDRERYEGNEDRRMAWLFHIGE